MLKTGGKLWWSMYFSSIKGVQGWYGCFYIYLYSQYIYLYICCMIWQLFHSPHFNYSIDFPPFNFKHDLPYVTQRFPGDGGLGPPQDARPTSPSGVPLASASTENDGSSRPCVRAPGPYTWCLAGLAVRWMMGGCVESTAPKHKNHLRIYALIFWTTSENHRFQNHFFSGSSC